MEDRNIKYTGREFSDFKEQLVEMVKNYFPTTYSDFSEDSPGMMFIEMASYVGDVLSFYQDIQLQETFLQHAKNPANLYTLAYMMGYTPKISSPSRVLLQVSQEVDAVFQGGEYVPNWNQALRVERGMKVSSLTGNGSVFITEDTVDFHYSSSFSPTEISIQEIIGGNPTTFLLTKSVSAVSGEVKTVQRTVTAPEKYLTLEIEDQNIIGIEKVEDIQGNEWKEVPFLGQETIFVDQVNTGGDQSSVPYLLALQPQPRRFVSRFLSPTLLQLQFGSGVTGGEDNTFLPNPNTLSGNSTLDKAYDPSNFLFTNTYGLAPSNTSLTIQYRVGRGVVDNIAAGTLTEIIERAVSGNSVEKQGTLSVLNPSPGYGGRDGDTVEEIRENSFRAFSEQKRTVTLQDYIIRALSLPSRYGSISKVYVRKEDLGNRVSSLERNPLAIQMYVLGQDLEGKLTPVSEGIKQNLRTYLSQYTPLTDSLNILDAYIINIGVSYEVTIQAGQNPGEILVQCNQALQRFFNTANMNINTSINLSDLSKLLSGVKGVQSVVKVVVENKAGGNYSPYGYDISGATKNNTIYPSFDPCIFEVKYPGTDITGRALTL